MSGFKEYPISTSGGESSSDAVEIHYKSDVGYADAIVSRYADAIRFCPDENTWLIFSESQGWQRDSTGEIRALVADFARAQYADACRRAAGLDPEAGKKLVTVMASLGDQRRINPALQIAQSNRAVVVRADSLDSDHDVVGVENGLVDLRDGTFHPHDKSRLVTRRLATPFIDGATAPNWENFLARVQPDIEMREFLRRWAGYCLHGAIREHVLPFHFGTGANGKGTFLEQGLLRLLGTYGAKMTDALVYSSERGSPPHLEIAGLCGKRLALGEENEDGGRLNEGILKAITGGDRVKGRFHYGNFLEYWPTYKIALVGNHKPRITGTDDGIWRRFLLVNWPVQIPEAERDPELKDKLLLEMPGILNWALAGARDWRSNGLRPPESCKLATKAFRESSDVLSEFLNEEILQDGAGYVSKADVFNRYVDWAGKSGVSHKMSKRGLGIALVNRGWQETKIARGKQDVWLHWRLRPDLD